MKSQGPWALVQHVCSRCCLPLLFDSGTRPARLSHSAQSLLPKFLWPWRNNKVDVLILLSSSIYFVKFPFGGGSASHIKCFPPCYLPFPQLSHKSFQWQKLTTLHLIPKLSPSTATPVLCFQGAKKKRIQPLLSATFPHRNIVDTGQTPLSSV